MSFDPILGGIDQIDTDRYEAVKRAIMTRTGVKPSHTDILRIMAQMDTNAYNRRMAGRTVTKRTPAGKPIGTVIRDQIPAGRASGSFGATSTHPWTGGYKGPKAGDVVTIAGVSPEMPRRRTIQRNVASKRNFGGTPA